MEGSFKKEQEETNFILTECFDYIKENIDDQDLIKAEILECIDPQVPVTDLLQARDLILKGFTNVEDKQVISKVIEIYCSENIHELHFACGIMWLHLKRLLAPLFPFDFFNFMLDMVVSKIPNSMKESDEAKDEVIDIIMDKIEMTELKSLILSLPIINRQNLYIVFTFIKNVTDIILEKEETEKLIRENTEDSFDSDNNINNKEGVEDDFIMNLLLIADVISPILTKPTNTAFMSIRHRTGLSYVRLIVLSILENFDELNDTFCSTNKDLINVPSAIDIKVPVSSNNSIIKDDCDSSFKSSPSNTSSYKRRSFASSASSACSSISNTSSIFSNLSSSISNKQNNTVQRVVKKIQDNQEQAKSKEKTLLTVDICPEMEMTDQQEQTFIDNTCYSKNNDIINMENVSNHLKLRSLANMNGDKAWLDKFLAFNKSYSFCDNEKNDEHKPIKIEKIYEKIVDHNFIYDDQVENQRNKESDKNTKSKCKNINNVSDIVNHNLNRSNSDSTLIIKQQEDTEKECKLMQKKTTIEKRLDKALNINCMSNESNDDNYNDNNDEGIEVKDLAIKEEARPAHENLLLDLEANKKKLKLKLKQFDEDFEKVNGRRPSKVDKEPIRPLYEEYNLIKRRIHVCQIAGMNEEFHNINNSCISPVSNVSNSSNKSTRQKMNFSTTCSTNYNNITDESLLSNASLRSSLLAEKKVLQVSLRNFEQKFEFEHGRKIKYIFDIKGRESEYRRYKELKKSLNELSNSTNVGIQKTREMKKSNINSSKFSLSLSPKKINTRKFNTKILAVAK